MAIYRRRLPHVVASTLPVFLTWRLHGSLPVGRAFSSGELSSGEKFAALDRLLDDAKTGPTWLRRAEVASMVEVAMVYGQDGLRHYELHAWVIMSNHVHLLVTPCVDLPVMLASLKRITARRCNEVLGLKGPFWAEETFDRTVRNRKEFGRISAYIENNPVRAGLVAAPELYRWSSAWGG